MTLKRRDLEDISTRTLDHYNRRAEDFWKGTRGHDVSQNIAALLAHIEGEPPFAILDLGCGPGRDLKAFAGLGHVAIGLEGSERFAAMAREHSGCEVWRQDLLAPALPRGALRRRVRQRGAVPRAGQGAAARPARAAREPEAQRRAVQLEPARRQRGGLEPRPLRRVSRPGDLAALHDRGRFRGARALLPPRGPAARPPAPAR